MSKLLSLNGKILRSRIDGANFTALIPFNPDNFKTRSIRPNNDEKSTNGFDLSSLINFYSNCIVDSFGLTQQNVSSTAKGVRICETNSLGIFCEINKRNFDIQILIQFKGLFFIRDNAFCIMQQLINEISIDISQFFRLTLIDVAKDILLSPWQVLPSTQRFIDENYFCYNFKHQLINYREQKSGLSVDTGFEVKNSRFKVKIYDKRYENSSHRNEAKRIYYESLYSSFIDESGNFLPVSRFELTLRQESCHPFSKLLYDTSISEDLFINSVLLKFGKNHSLRQKPIESNDQNVKRWPIAKNWSDLFFDSSELSVEVKTDSTHRFSNPRINISTQTEKLIEALAQDDGCSLDTISPDRLLSLVEVKLCDIINRAKERRQQHEQTISSQERNLREVEVRVKDSQIPLVGDFL